MKNIFFLLLLISPLFLTQAQVELPIDEDSGLVTYTEVIEVEGVSKDVLYDRVLEAINKYTKDADTDDKIMNKEKGMIDVKMFNDLPLEGITDKPYKGKIWFRLLVLFKEGRYKITAKEIKHQGEAINGTAASKYPAEITQKRQQTKDGKPRNVNIKFVENTGPYFEKLFDQIEHAAKNLPEIEEKQAIEKEDDW